MTILLISPYSKEPAAAIEENKDGRTLKIFDKNLKRTLEVNGITQSEKRHGIWRVFPDGNPEYFLEAFEKDFFHGLAGKGYCWVKQEDYTDEEAWIKRIVETIIQVK